MKLASVIYRFSEYCNPKKTISILCHNFFTCSQQEGQIFHDFVTESKNLISKCEVDNLQDSLIKNMILWGTRDNSLHERILWRCNTTLLKVISADHATEKAHEHARKILRSQLTANINKIFKTKFIKSSHSPPNQKPRDFIKKCKFCNSSHT